MPTSPGAASVVERLRSRSTDGFNGHTILLTVPELSALLAVVEAAKALSEDFDRSFGGVADWAPSVDRLRDALDVLSAQDSAESKDAEGAKP